MHGGVHMHGATHDMHGRAWVVVLVARGAMRTGVWLAAWPCACACAHGPNGGCWCLVPMAISMGIWTCHEAVHMG